MASPPGRDRAQSHPHLFSSGSLESLIPKSTSFISLFTKKESEKEFDPVTILENSDFFNNLSKKELKIISKKTTLLKFSENQILFQRGSRSSSAYIVCQGTVEIGPEKVHKYQAYELIGEEAFFSDRHRTYSLSAFEGSVLLEIPVSVFKDVVCSHFENLKNFYIRLSNKIRENNEQAHLSIERVLPAEENKNSSVEQEFDKHIQALIEEKIASLFPNKADLIKDEDFISKICERFLKTSLQDKCESILDLAIYVREYREKFPKNEQAIALFEGILIQQVDKFFHSSSVLDSVSAAKLLFASVQVSCLQPYFKVLKSICKEFYKPNERDETYRNFQIALLMDALTKEGKILKWEDKLKEIALLLKKITVLDNTELCKSLSFIEKVDLYFSSSLEKCKMNDVVFREGDAGDFLCVMISGYVDVLVGGKLKAIKWVGDFFGDMALIGGKRSATIRVGVDETEILKISKKTFDAFLEGKKEFLLKLIKINTYFLLKKNAICSDFEKELKEKLANIKLPEKYLKKEELPSIRRKTELLESENIKTFIRNHEKELKEIRSKIPILSYSEQVEKLYGFFLQWEENPEKINNLYGFKKTYEDPSGPQKTFSSIPLTEFIRSLSPRHECLDPIEISINHFPYTPPKEITGNYRENVIADFLLTLCQNGLSPHKNLDQIHAELAPLMSAWDKYQCTVERSQNTSDVKMFSSNLMKACTNGAWMPADALIRTTLKEIYQIPGEGVVIEHYPSQFSGVGLDIRIVSKNDYSVSQTKYVVLLDPVERKGKPLEIHAIIPFRWTLSPEKDPVKGELTIPRDPGIILGPKPEINKKVIAYLLHSLKAHLK